MSYFGSSNTSLCQTCVHCKPEGNCTNVIICLVYYRLFRDVDPLITVKFPLILLNFTTQRSDVCIDRI